MPNFGPLFRLQTPDPNSFVERTPDLTGAVDPFAHAANALTAGLMVAEQRTRERMEADRAYELQARQLEQSVSQFDQVHELNQLEAQNLANYRTESLGLQKQAQQLMREKQQIDAQAIGLEMELDRERLNQFRRASERETNTYKSFQETVEAFKNGGGIASGPITTFSHVGNLKDLEDNGIGFDGQSTANVPGVSINQKMFEAQFPGETKESIRNNFEVDIIDERTGKVLGTLPIVDRGPSDKVIAEKGPVLDVTAAGILELGGKLITKGNAIVGHSLQGNHTFRVRRKDAPLPIQEGEQSEMTLSKEFSGVPVEANVGSTEPVQGMSAEPPEPDLIGLHDYLKSVEENPMMGEEARMQAQQERKRLGANPQVAARINQINASEFANKFAMPDFVTQEFIRRASNHPKVLEEQDLAVMAKTVHDLGVDAVKAMTPEFNKPVAETNKRTQALRTAVSDIRRLERALENVNEPNQFLGLGDRGGRIEGRILSGLNKIKEQGDISTLQATINAMIPNLARGVFGEVGVLTDTDIARYRDLVADHRDSPTLQKALVQVLREKLYSEIKADVDAAETIRGEDPRAIREYYRRGGVDVEAIPAEGSGPATVNAGGTNVKTVPQGNGLRKLAPVK